MFPTKSPSACRPGRLLGTSLASVTRRRPACVRRIGPLLGRPMQFIGEVDAASKTAVSISVAGVLLVLVLP